MQKLFLVETLHQFKLIITTDHNITSTGENCMCRICTINAESRNHSKCRCMYNVTLFPPPPQKKRKQKRTIMHNRQCSRWCMVETHISEQSISFEDTITAMFNSLWTTQKKFGITLPIRPSVRPSITLLHFSVHDYPRNKMYAVLSRIQAKRTPNQFCWDKSSVSVGLVITHFHFLAHFEIVA